MIHTCLWKSGSLRRSCCASPKKECRPARFSGPLELATRQHGTSATGFAPQWLRLTNHCLMEKSRWMKRMWVEKGTSLDAQKTKKSLSASGNATDSFDCFTLKM